MITTKPSLPSTTTTITTATTTTAAISPTTTDTIAVTKSPFLLTRKLLASDSPRVIPFFALLESLSPLLAGRPLPASTPRGLIGPWICDPAEADAKRLQLQRRALTPNRLKPAGGPAQVLLPRDFSSRHSSRMACRSLNG